MCYYLNVHFQDQRVNTLCLDHRNNIWRKAGVSGASWHTDNNCHRQCKKEPPVKLYSSMIGPDCGKESSVICNLWVKCGFKVSLYEQGNFFFFLTLPKDPVIEHKIYSYLTRKFCCHSSHLLCCAFA
jgi:hypothetical protein